VPSHLAVSIPEPGVEEAGIVGAQLAAGRFIGHHLSGITRRHPNALFGRQDIKLLRFQEETVLPVPFQGFPEVESRIMSDFGQIDDMAVFLGPVADDRVFPRASGEVDPQEEAAICAEFLLRERLRGRGIMKEQRIGPVEFLQGTVGDRGIAAHETNLIQGVTGAYFDGKERGTTSR
jgi:hypothetical protein